MEDNEQTVTLLTWDPSICIVSYQINHDGEIYYLRIPNDLTTQNAVIAIIKTDAAKKVQIIIDKQLAEANKQEKINQLNNTLQINELIGTDL